MPTDYTKLLDGNALRAIRDYIADNCQPLNASLTAIAALTTTSGFLKRTGSTTWELSSLTANDIPSLAASKITSGTFADARIASASTWNAKTKVTLNGSAVTTASIYAPTTSGTAGQVLQSNGSGSAPTWVTPVGGGSVSSVALSMPTGFTVSGSPITSIGTLTVSMASGYQLMNDSAAQTFGGYKTFSSRTTFDGGIRIYDEDQDEYIAIYGDATELSIDGSSGGIYVSGRGYVAFQNEVAIYQGSCPSTDSTSITKTVSVNNSFKLVKGVKVQVYFESDNLARLMPDSSTSPVLPISLNVNSTGAKQIIRVGQGGIAEYPKLIRKGDVVTFEYDGSYWIVTSIQKAPKRDTLWKSPSSQSGVPTGAKYFGDTNAGLDIDGGRTTWLQLDLLDYDVLLFTCRATSSTTGNVARPTFTIPVKEFKTRTVSTNDVYITWSNADTSHTCHIIYLKASSIYSSSSKDGFNILADTGLYKDFIVYGIRYSGKF